MSLPPNWPNRQHSRMVACGALTWHVQIAGDAKPVLLMLHGTGATTHSWRGLLPLLQSAFTVVAPDLPGHGFTKTPGWQSLSLPAMASAVAGLLQQLGLAPACAVGHSAGAAILARMCLDGLIAPATLISINGAFIPLASPAAPLFAPLARMLVRLPGVPQLFALQVGSPAMVAKLLDGTGSRLDEGGIALYAQAVRTPGHAAGALRMMASWDLAPLLRDLPALAPRLLLIVGGNDRAIPPDDAAKIARLVPGARVHIMPGLGHLSHEEDPQGTAALIRDFASQHTAA